MREVICSEFELFVVSEEQRNRSPHCVVPQMPPIWPVSAMLANNAYRRLPRGATPHLNNNATKEHYTNESEGKYKGGNVHMEQNWAEKEDCK